MKKFLAAIAALMMMTGAAECAGGVTGFVRLQPDLGFTVIEREGVSAPGDRGAAAVGLPLGGGSKRAWERVIKMQLISCGDDLSKLSDDEITRWYKDGVAPAGKNIFLTETTDREKYEIKDVPPGEYFWVIITSAMSGYDMSPKTSKTNEELAKFLPRWDSYQLLTIGLNQYAVQKIRVEDGAMTRADYDFAAPPFSEK